MTTQKHNRRLSDAREKTEEVQDTLGVAEAELSLSNAILGNSLPKSTRADTVVALALQQSVAVEEKMHDAADQLKTITVLLKHEEQHSAELERELADPAQSVRRSGEGIESMLPYLPKRSSDGLA